VADNKDINGLLYDFEFAAYIDWN